MLSPILTLLCISPVVQSVAIHQGWTTRTTNWDLSQFSSLITFGDSYTSENSTGFSTSTGGISWPRYVVQYTGHEDGSQFVPQLSLYNLALSGSTCDNNVAPRIFGTTINVNFPAIVESQLPVFTADQSKTNADGTPFFTPPLGASDTVYVVWIGTNDLGDVSFLTDSQWPGKTLTDYVNCVFGVLDSLYAAGGRQFVVNNVIPLELTPLYANDSFGGVGPNRYWQDKPANHTAISEQVTEYVTTVNDVFKYQVPYEVLIASRYPGASVALFDLYNFIINIYTHPTMFFNGSAPANVTGFENHCAVDGSDCVLTDSPDSFLWFDELHPSEQTDRNFAREFVNVLSGNSTFASYYEG